MKNTQINRIATKKIALALGELNGKVIYVGGAVVSLYIDDPAAEDVRPTKDIDITLEIANFSELEALREQLIKRGFHQSHEDEVICRFRFEDIKVDVMSTIPVGWVPANPWFKYGFKQPKQVDLDGVKIKILPFPVFLATKFSAFYDRGGSDPRASHDFEDIVYLLNYTSNSKELIFQADREVQQFLKKAFGQMLDSDKIQEAIYSNLFYENRQQRFERIILLMKTICR